jgi:hypothetical protein
MPPSLQTVFPRSSEPIHDIFSDWHSLCGWLPLLTSPAISFAAVERVEF